jgi:hypothetical protein
LFCSDKERNILLGQHAGMCLVGVKRLSEVGYDGVSYAKSENGDLDYGMYVGERSDEEIVAMLGLLDSQS